MDNLFNKIYEAVNSGIQKALIISDGQSQDISVNFHHKEISTKFDPYEYRTVNLELPSGLLWCEYNLGASPGNNFKDWYGDYYAWGETVTKTDYSVATSKYRNEENIYRAAELSQLNLNDDVINCILGNPYRMPTENDFKELLNNTTHEWVTNYNGIRSLNGILFTSKNNDNTLFFPASGNYYKHNQYGDNRTIHVWSATHYRNMPVSLYVSPDNCYVKSSDHFYGLSIRGVKDNANLKTNI